MCGNEATRCWQNVGRVRPVAFPGSLSPVLSYNDEDVKIVTGSLGADMPGLRGARNWKKESIMFDHFNISRP